VIATLRPKIALFGALFHVSPENIAYQRPIRCQSAFKADLLLECAPWGGQIG
jgi:hypothetical protein